VDQHQTQHPANGTFIDAHLHLYPPKRLSALIRWMHSFFPDHPVPKDATLGDVLGDLEQHGYKNFVALVFALKPGESKELNTFIAEMAESVSGLVPFGCVHVDDTAPETIVGNAIQRLGLAGLKFHPMVQRFDPWDPRLFTVFERMNAWRKPIYVHTGFDDWYGYHLPVASLKSLLSTYPDIPFVFSHMLMPNLALAFELADEFSNLYLDATNVFGTIAMFRRMDSVPPGLDLEAARAGTERLCERILFGTDHPAGMGSIGNIIQDVRDFGLSPNAELEILYGTASRFLHKHCSRYCVSEPR
jgi:predicted TIM-barrel fold metal-dependent hydrolase